VPSGYPDADATHVHVDENEFNGPDMVELSALEKSFVITYRTDYRLWVTCSGGRFDAYEAGERE